MKKTKFNLISNITSMLLCLTLLIFGLFAWYTSNKEVTANGITAMTSSETSIHFKDTVTAKRYSLTGDITTNTYTKQSDGTLILTKQVLYVAKDDSTTTVTEFATTTYFSITELLPGEYVDVTVGYYMDPECNGNTYKLKLTNIVADSFKVQYNEVDYTHYVTGAFKHRSLSLKDEAGNTPANFTASTEDTWFSSYEINQNDSSTVEVQILNHTWLNSYESLYYTFRITEDFSQYYQLIAKSSESYGNLLSEKNFKIGKIYLMF